ncbi:MAG: DUF5916 domain-containing protein [Bacteroidota bacterium]
MHRVLLVLLVGLTGLFPSYLSGQNQGKNDDYHLPIKQATEKIKLDGLLDEASWQKAAVAKDFWMSFPTDGEKVPQDIRSEARLTYDQQYIYVGITCYGDNKYIIQTLKRDTDFWDGDAFALVLDPVNKRANGFIFGVNPAGVQFESLVTGQTGGRGTGPPRGFNSAWDNKWFSQVKTYPNRWVIEMAIPYKTLRFEAGNDTWGINFIRGDAKNNSFHVWAPVPVQFYGPDLGYLGLLKWDQAPAKVKRNFSIIPYVLGSYDQDLEAKGPQNYGGRIGLDAKVAVSSSLNLDLTINPDFSQVDVDEQVTNLTRFNVRFPERRLFFLENSDLFSDFGIPPMRPFFSRRVGLDEEGNTIPILYGARLSGNLNDKTRIALMNLQTRPTEDFHGQNYTSAAAQYRIFSRSMIKGYIHNRQAMEAGETLRNDFNRTAGMETRLISKDGSKQAFGGLGISLNPEDNNKNYFYQIGTSYTGKRINFYTNMVGVGDNYIADLGFIPLMSHYDAIADTTYRLGFHHGFARLSYTHFAKSSSPVISHRWSIRDVFDFTTSTNVMFNNEWEAAYDLTMRNTSRFNLSLQNSMVRLFYPFGFTDADPLPADKYRFNALSLQYNSDQRKLFGFRAGFQYGGFYNGERIQYTAGVFFRAQPWGNFSLNFVRNDLTFPEPYGSETLLLISPRIEINFSRNIFWTTFLQYNTQADNFNINSRLQWRFQPMSDLFIVYSDNYAVEFWGPKNRALVIKLNYWLNL